MPADDRRRNLVAEREHQRRRMIGQRANVGCGLPPNGPLELTVVEERDVLRPWQPDHQAQTLTCGLVEQIDRWRGVRADRVDARGGHQREVLRDSRCARELQTGRVGRERPVRHTFDEEATALDREELTVHVRLYHAIVSTNMCTRASSVSWSRWGRVGGRTEDAS